MGYGIEENSEVRDDAAGSRRLANADAIQGLGER
jgi:hypothetical protein